MTYLDGMDWAAAQHADQDLKNTWAEVILRFATGSYRHANFFNADPHPGNYRFDANGQVGFVDFGCVKVLPERQRRGFVEMFRAAVDGRKQVMRDRMAELGLFAGGSTLSAEEAYQWMAQLVYELLEPQPVTYTQEPHERAIRDLVDLRSSDHPVRRMSIPDDLIFLIRIPLMVNPIVATLGATVHARSIIDDMDGVAEPITPLGKLHDAWVRQRGLPYGLEPHDHP